MICYPFRLLNVGGDSSNAISWVVGLGGLVEGLGNSSFTKVRQNHSHIKVELQHIVWSVNNVARQARKGMGA